MSARTIRCTACGAPGRADYQYCEFCGAAIIHALGGLGLLRASKPHLDKVFSQFKARLRKDPDDADALFGMAAYFFKRELYKEASEHLRRAAQNAPISAEVHYLHALTYAHWRGWTNVLLKQHAERALKLDGRMKEARSLLHIYNGVCRCRSAQSRDHLNQALQHMQKAKVLGIRAHMPHIYFFCGEAFEQARQPDNAVKMYRAARDFGMKDPKVFARLGMIQKHAGQFKLARRNLEKAHELNPDNAVIKRQLDTVRAALGSPPKKGRKFGGPLSF